ncbi:hypothetical protein [Streptomyces sp. DH12]|uniref:hypothetical protein n=1 Tax=Streptomyces sp. DH12 TaxID=2857010 RepID=UPI001E582FC3|nr:hypothetical protein [Streptomyces sp. DH12]
MPRTDARRRRPALLVPVLVGAVLGLLLGFGGWRAGTPGATGMPGATGTPAAIGAPGTLTAAGTPAAIGAPGTLTAAGAHPGRAVTRAALPGPSGAPAWSAVPRDAAGAGGAGGAGTPGCDDGSRSGDGGLAPATLPRGPSAGELLPAPYDARGAVPAAGSAAGQPAGTTPGRAPPGLVPPSPMDLSILRV